jgi:hypothetical protein
MAGPYAYVSLSNGLGSSGITKIDLSNFTGVNTTLIASAASVPSPVVVDASETYVYTGDASTGYIYRITISTGAVSSLSIGNPVNDMVINGSYLYAVAAKTLYKIDLTNFTGTPATLVVTSANYALHSLAIDPLGDYAYIAPISGYVTEVIFKVDLSTFANDGSLAFANYQGTSGVKMVAIDSSGTYLYALTAAGVVSKIDLSSFSVSQTLTITGGDLVNLTIDPGDHHLYVNDHLNTGTLYKVDLTNFTGTPATLAVGQQAAGMAIDAAGNFAYLVEQNSYAVSKIDLSSFSIVASATNSVRDPVGIALGHSAVAAEQMVMMA